MPIDPNVAWNVAGQLAGSAANTIATSDINKKTRQWNEKMYGLQRADALADWNMQNDYNSPMAQMQRLKAAGLNPNLVYGHGADAGAMSPVRSTDVKGWSPSAPRYNFDFGQAALIGLQVKQQRSQLETQMAQRANIASDSQLKQAQAASTLVNADLGKFDLGYKTEFRKVSGDLLNEQLRKLRTDVTSTADANARANQMQPYSIANAIEQKLRSQAERSLVPERRASLLATIANKEVDTLNKKLDNELKQLGIQPSDSLLMRFSGRIVNWIKEHGVKGLEGLYNEFRDTFK